MKIIILLCLYFIYGIEPVDFNTALTNLENLEKYIRTYKEEKSCTQTLTHLIVCYIREGAYTGSSWKIAGGSIPSDLPNYIIEKDSIGNTNAQAVKTYGEIELPNNEKIDFVHFFAVMNGIEYGKSYTANYAHLVGWGGDTFQLLQNIKNQNGDLEQLMEIAKGYFRIKGGFGAADYVSDLDAPIILNKKNDNNNFAEILKEYYNGKEYSDRINKFVKLTFPNLKKKDQFREELFKLYSTDTFINVLECQDGIRESGFTCYIPGALKPQYTEHQKAAVYVVSDYLSDNYIEEIDPEPEPQPEPDPEPQPEPDPEPEPNPDSDQDKTQPSNYHLSLALNKFYLILLFSLLFLKL